MKIIESQIFPTMNKIYLWYEILKQDTWQSRLCMYIDVTILDLKQ
jgi:hypothetical protein